MRLETTDAMNRGRRKANGSEPMNRWAAAFEVFPSAQTLQKRLDRIGAALQREDWLPLGLRSLVVEELPRLRAQLALGRTDERFEAARAQVHELALASFSYGPRLLDSEAVAQLRVLDLELNPPAAQARRMAG